MANISYFGKQVSNIFKETNIINYNSDDLSDGISDSISSNVPDNKPDIKLDDKKEVVKVSKNKTKKSKLPDTQSTNSDGSIATFPLEKKISNIFKESKNIEFISTQSGYDEISEPTNPVEKQIKNILKDAENIKVDKYNGSKHNSNSIDKITSTLVTGLAPISGPIQHVLKENITLNIEINKKKEKNSIGKEESDDKNLIIPIVSQITSVINNVNDINCTSESDSTYTKSESQFASPYIKNTHTRKIKNLSLFEEVDNKDSFKVILKSSSESGLESGTKSNTELDPI
jgi:hypothetical protein